ncbi:MAG: restriction endonuclease subunit S [Erysipelotrichaceae bacterium]|nr:restriction endonuclease subunit S [Erysipelotrichaceae bacterium]
MIYLLDVCAVKPGISQARIHMSPDNKAPIYFIYSADDLRNDLTGMVNDCWLPDERVNNIHTYDELDVLEPDDLVYSILSHTAALVSKAHAGFILTSNFVKLEPNSELDKRYLMFLLNCDPDARASLLGELDGSYFKRVTIKSLGNLEIPELPDLKTQQMIGETYVLQKRLTGKRQESLELKEKYVIESLLRKVKK